MKIKCDCGPQDTLTLTPSGPNNAGVPNLDLTVVERYSGGDDATVVLTPKSARKLAKALRKWAHAADNE